MGLRSRKCGKNYILTAVFSGALQLAANPVCAVLEESSFRLHVVATGGDVISRIPFNKDSDDWFMVNIAFTRNQFSVQGMFAYCSNPWSDLQKGSTDDVQTGSHKEERKNLPVEFFSFQFTQSQIPVYPTLTRNSPRV